MMAGYQAFLIAGQLVDATHLDLWTLMCKLGKHGLDYKNR